MLKTNTTCTITYVYCTKLLMFFVCLFFSRLITLLPRFMTGWYIYRNATIAPWWMAKILWMERTWHRKCGITPILVKSQSFNLRGWGGGGYGYLERTNSGSNFDEYVYIDIDRTIYPAYCFYRPKLYRPRCKCNTHTYIPLFQQNVTIHLMHPL